MKCKPIDVASRARILGVNIWNDLKKEVQGNEVFFLYFGANGTPDLNPIVINDKPIDVASRAKGSRCKYFDWP